MTVFPKTVVKARNHIMTKYPDLMLIRGDGYFYFVSDTNEELSTKLGGCYTTSVYVNNASDLSLDAWMSEADDIMDQCNNPHLYHRGMKMQQRKA